jgi:hypothetical protein
MRTREEMIAEMKGKTIPTVEVRRFIAEILMTEKIKGPQTLHYELLTGVNKENKDDQN